MPCGGIGGDVLDNIGAVAQRPLRQGRGRNPRLTLKRQPIAQIHLPNLLRAVFRDGKRHKVLGVPQSPEPNLAECKILV